MHAVVAARVELAQHLHFVRHVVAVAVGDAIHAAGDFFLIIIHADIQRIEGKEHAVHAADVRRHFFDVALAQRLACGGRFEAVEHPILVAHIDAARVIRREVHPRALLAARHAVNELHLEVL